MNCDDTTLSLGVYLLGSLSAEEQAEVERHLQTCEPCRSELDQLAGLPSMLDLLTLDDLAAEPLDAPEDLFQRVAARAREEAVAQRTTQVRRYRRLTAVAAAVVLIAGGSASAAVLLHTDRHAAPAVAASHSLTKEASQNGISMRVTLAAQASGTGLQVAVSGLPENEHCRLIAVSKDGQRDLAGAWSATYGGDAKQLGSTVIPRGQISQLVLLGTGGKHLVTVAV